MRRFSTGSISDLLDVLIATPVAGNVLSFDSGQWRNKTLASAGIATSDHNHNSNYLALAGGVLTGSLELNNILPLLIFNETDQAVDKKKWLLLTHNAEVVFQTRKDDDTYLANVMYLDRSGNIRISGNITCGSGKTLCTNLNADQLDGNEASAFATSGHNHSSDYLALTGGTLTGNITVSAAGPIVKWNETDQAEDEKLWAAFPYGAYFYIQSQNDSGVAIANILKLGRSGITTIGGTDGCLIFASPVSPTLSTDQAAIYGADQAAGNRCIHAKSEAGNVVKLFTGAAVANATDATTVIARLNDLLARMRANGLIAT